LTTSTDEYFKIPF